MMKEFLENTGLFQVDVYRTAYTWQGPHYDKSIGLEDITQLLEMYPIENGQQTTPVDEPKPDPDFHPDFDRYAVVITNMGWKASTWPQDVQNEFENYMEDGGGLVVVHAANNSWGDWEAYNRMIGLGGWGGRGEGSGYFVSLDDQGKEHYTEPEQGCGSHGPQHEFVLQNRAPEHPVMKGLPEQWLHTKDELYAQLCGPAVNLTVLATAYSDPDQKGTGNHEPMTFAIDYGKGRVFHTALGHMDYSMECVGFITTFQRGTEWAATGRVSQKVPEDFPGTEQISARKWDK
jgi:type 1 glutamine amidotransferase